MWEEKESSLSHHRTFCYSERMSETKFQITEDDTHGGCLAGAHGHSVVTVP